VTRGWLLSGILHVAIAAAIYFGMPDFARLPPTSDVPITVEVVSEAELKPAAPAPAPAATAPEPPREAASPPKPPPPAPEPEPEVVEAPPEPEPAPPPEPAEVAELEPPPMPEPEVAEPAPEPELEPAPEPVEVAERPRAIQPPPERPAPPPRPDLKPRTVPAAARSQPPPPPAEPEEDSFEAFLRSVESQSEQLQAEERREGQGRALEGTAEANAAHGQGTPSLLPFEELAVKQQIAACWRLPPGVVGTEDMVVRLRIEVGRDRRVQRVTIEDQSRVASDPVFRAVAESAQRAVTSCGPLRLAPEKYAAWREMVLNFRPEDAIRS
jgi:hypothetical protein